MRERYILLMLVILFCFGCGAAKSGRSSAHYPAEAGYYEEGAVYATSVPMAKEKAAFGFGGGGDYEMEEAMVEAEYAGPMAGAEDEYMDTDGLILAAEKPVPVPGEATSDKATEVEPPESSMPDAVVEGRVIIYDARVVLAVFQVQEDLENIRKKIKDWEGYMISMSSNTIVFRVPVEKFDDIVDEISGMGELISKDITGQDVTDEFRDLTIKLKNALATRDRLIELFGKAKTVKESLIIEAELKRLLEEIELIKGRLKFLKESALYSKITVYLESKETYKKPIPKLPAPLQWLQYELGLNALFEQ